MWWIACCLLASNPSLADVEPWLGRYVAGPETIAFNWDDERGFVYHHGNIPIPVDGAWHVTVPEFYVRHRASWLADTRAVRLEESHNESKPWRHELRLADDGGERLVKVSLSGGPDGGEVVVRTFSRTKEGMR
jgi:hypothetical protein